MSDKLSVQNDLHVELEVAKAELEVMRESAKAACRLDSLTGVSTSVVFLERLDQQCIRAARYSEAFAVMAVEIDDIEAIEGQYSNETLDYVLKGTALLIQNELRGVDCIARLSKSTFGIVAPHTTRQDAVQLADRLRCKIETAAWVP